ncbi:MAG: diaminopimelate epimerase [Planctomycetota bacterium]
MRVPFVKMEGAGNDYVFVDAIRHPVPLELAPALARQWSDRHRGIGGDGLVLLRSSSTAAVAMSMWNADGSAGAMCGNGLRCLAVLARDHGHVATDAFPVETPVGVRQVELLRDAAGVVTGARVDLGPVHVERAARALRLGDRTLRYHRGDAGNPHAVVLLDGDPAEHPVVEDGAAMQTHPDFPGGVNVEFVHVRSDGSLVQRTFERGSGETQACGSGAAAAAMVALELGLVPGPEVLVRLRGGDLQVRRGDGSLVLVGPARTVFCGEVELHPQP